MDGWLYRAEARGIQGWILASDRLAELRGGSALVEQLADDARKRVEAAGGRCELAAAGSIEAWFPDLETMRSFAEHWPLWVERRAPGLRLAHAWGPADDPDALMARLGSLSPRPPADLPEAGPLLARAGRTGLPAVRKGDKDGLEDAATRAKVDMEVDGLGKRLLPDDTDSERWVFLDDLNAFDEGYLGVIHADGNRIGRLFRGLGPNPEERWRLSRALSEATLAAAREAVARLCELSFLRLRDDAPRGEDGRGVNVQARPVVLGGDDLTFIVHGRDALPFTAYYLRAFEREARRRVSEHPALATVTACAGVALVKKGWPFHAAHALADSLCKAAKRQLRAREASGLLFHRVTTALSDLEWEDVVRRELGAAGERSFAWGALTLNALHDLEALTSAASRLPRGALRGWLADARDDAARADARWDRLREIALHGSGDSDPRDWEAFRQALEAFGVNPEIGWTPQVPATTPLADALTWLTLQPGSVARLWSSHAA